MKLTEYTQTQRKKDCQSGTIYHYSGNQYKVTGFLYNSKKRFTILSPNAHYAIGINLWNGRRYVKYADEQKFRLFQTISN